MKRSPLKRKTPLHRYTPLKRTPLRKVSLKMARQKRKEKELIQVLLVRCKGLCEKCGQLPDFRGLAKHEKIHRSQGGNPLDPSNCLMVCGRSHSAEHGVREIVASPCWSKKL